MKRATGSAIWGLCGAWVLWGMTGCSGPMPVTPGVDLGGPVPEPPVDALPPAPVTTAWTYEHPRPAGNLLRAAWTSGSETFAVGELGTVVHLAGTSGEREATGLATATLRALTGTADDLWAVGDDGMVLHRSTGKWTAERLGPALYAAWTRGETLFAVGQGGRLWQRGAAGWSSSALPGLPAGATLFAAIAVGEDRYLAGSGGRILHYQAATQSWYIEGDGLSSLPWYALHADASGAVYAVGAAGRIARRDPQTGVFRLEATEMPPLTRADLRAVFSIGSTVYAVAESGTVLRRPSSAGSWQLDASPPTAGLFYGGAGAASGGVIVGAAGQIYQRGPGPGDMWVSALPSPTLTTQTVAALAALPDGTVLAATEDGQILRRDKSAPTWTSEYKLAGAQRQPLSGLWASPTSAAGEVDAYAVGLGGTLLQRVAGVWTPVTYPSVGTRPDWHGVWGRGTGLVREVYVVGNAVTNVGKTVASVLRLFGGTWTSDGPSPEVNESLYAVGATDTDVLAVGTHGTVLRRSGATTWTQELGGLASDVELFALATIGKDLYAVGTRGTLLFRDGSGMAPAWTRSLVAEGLYGLNAVVLAGTGGHELWVAGTAGFIGHRSESGKSWTFESTLASTTLSGLARAGDGLFAAGSSGAILRRSLTP